MSRIPVASQRFFGTPAGAFAQFRQAGTRGGLWIYDRDGRLLGQGALTSTTSGPFSVPGTWTGKVRAEGSDYELAARVRLLDANKVHVELHVVKPGYKPGVLVAWMVANGARGKYAFRLKAPASRAKKAFAGLLAVGLIGGAAALLWR